MNNKSMLSWVGGLISLVVVLVIVVSIWVGTNPGPSQEQSTNPHLAPLKTDQISADNLSDVSSLQKNGAIPVTNVPTDLGRPNPFATL